jgi:hypothetical protein
MRRGYVCEEQDFELLHLPIFPLTSIQQCAEAVASQMMCSPVFWTGLATGKCGCVKRGYECAFNEGNDQQFDMNVYMLSPGSMKAPVGPMIPAGLPGASLPAATGGVPVMPGAGNMFKPTAQQHPLAPGGAIFTNPKFEAPEAPEAEDL